MRNRVYGPLDPGALRPPVLSLPGSITDHRILSTFERLNTLLLDINEDFPSDMPEDFPEYIQELQEDLNTTRVEFLNAKLSFFLAAKWQVYIPYCGISVTLIKNILIIILFGMIDLLIHCSHLR
jgi:hypothetical protein